MRDSVIRFAAEHGLTVTRLSKDNGPASEEHNDSQRVHVAFP